MNLKELERAWASGFFDGEGSTIFCWREEKRDRSIRLTISQVNKNNLDRYKNAVECGYICGPYHRGNNKPIYHFRCDSNSEVNKALRAMWPFLGIEKKKQAAKALKNYSRVKWQFNITKKRPYGPHSSPMSKEHRDKIAQSNRNRIISQETREKHRKAMLGENNPAIKLKGKTWIVHNGKRVWRDKCPSGA